MRLKIKRLVRRKMRRWGEGKGPLTKEQIACLDKHVHQTYWTYWPKAIYDFPELNKLLKEEDENGL